MAHRTKVEEEHCEFVKRLTLGQVAVLTENIKRYCPIDGLLFKSKEDPKLLYHIPLTLFPSPFPAEQLKIIHQLQTDVNLLLYRVSMDYDFLFQHTREVRRADPFVRSLVRILKKLVGFEYKQTIQAGIIRADYMIDDHRTNANQVARACLVEYNTISVSFGAQGDQVSGVHAEVLEQATNMVMRPPHFVGDQTKNKIADDIGMTLTSAWVEYFKRYFPSRSCLLFVVQQGERNVFDQAKIERHTAKHVALYHDRRFKNLQRPPIFYATLQELNGRIRVIENVGALIYSHPELKDDFEVAVVYFRSGYMPEDYKYETCWEVRTTLELNKAVKVPSIGLQLAGLKKIQQVLVRPEILERFVSPEAAKNILATFTGTYALDVSSVDLERILSKVKANPNEFVLKPQREGGGNNIYGEDISKELENLISQSKSLSSYVLMTMIHPTSYKNYLVFPERNEAIPCDCISELGQMGMYLISNTNTLFNLASSNILRTKNIEELDGGVASGRAVLDSVCLY